MAKTAAALHILVKEEALANELLAKLEKDFLLLQRKLESWQNNLKCLLMI